MQYPFYYIVINMLCLFSIFYINIVYFIIFKRGPRWNIELLQIFIFELVQYTFYQYFNTRMQIIQGYIAVARLFSIEVNRKICITI